MPRSKPTLPAGERYHALLNTRSLAVALNDVPNRRAPPVTTYCARVAVVSTVSPAEDVPGVGGVAVAVCSFVSPSRAVAAMRRTHRARSALPYETRTYASERVASKAGTLGYVTVSPASSGKPTVQSLPSRLLQLGCSVRLRRVLSATASTLHAFFAQPMRPTKSTRSPSPPARGSCVLYCCAPS